MSYKSKSTYKQNKRLPLVGENYKWFDRSKGVGGTDMKDTIPLSDESPRISGCKLFMNKSCQFNWYTEPSSNNKYKYSKINTEYIYTKIKNLKRASFIPYITTSSGNYWLLGSFHDFHEIKSDFGGTCKYGETPSDCANRELGEETQKILLAPVIDAVKQNKVTVFKGVNSKNDVVIFIMVNIDGSFEMLDDIQSAIDERFAEKFSDKTPGKDDLFGPLGFYKESEVLNFKTSGNKHI